ncbi:MAG: glycosyltransferase family 9 protein [Elusimicrobiota bacterium]
MILMKDAGYCISRFIDRYVGILLCFAFRGVKKKHRPVPGTQWKQILLIKFSLVGDTILLIPAIRAVRAAYPGAKITFVCSEINAEIIRSCPYVDAVIVSDLPSLFNPFYLFRFLRGINRRRYDVVVDFEQWFRFSALITFFIDAATKAGFKTAGQFRHWLFDIFVEHDEAHHEIACYADLLSALGISCADTALEWRTPPEASASAQKKLLSAGIGAGEKYMVIHPGSSHWVQKQWPEHRYAMLCNALVAMDDKKIILTGSSGEKALVRAVLSDVHDGSRVVSLAGELSLFELGAVLSNADVLVCGNTGVMHLACAVGTRILLINGPVSVEKWGPQGSGHRVVQARTECAPCVYLGFEYRCRKRTCMESIAVEDVIDAYVLPDVRSPL